MTRTGSGGAIGSEVRVGFRLLQAGYCVAHENVVLRGAPMREVTFPALFALIEHPERGPILYDTGYTHRFLAETETFPASLYRKLTPITLEDSELAVEQLERRGIAPADVAAVVVSHFHADHVAGLADFPNADYIFFEHGWRAVRHRRGLHALRAAFLPGLLPDDFEDRAAPVSRANERSIPPELGGPFDRAVDVLGDGSLLAVELPGHAPGQMGLLLVGDDGATRFLVADACWRSRAYRERILPHPITGALFTNTTRYRATLHRIASFAEGRPDALVVPSHCDEVAAAHVERA